MTEAKLKYANFPERDLKVVIGPNINASISKTLTRMSIGTYEMSFTQQEKGAATSEVVRQALQGHARATGMQFTSESSREFVACQKAENAEVRYQIWATTPFEPTQANHIIWVRYTELTGEKKTGVAFKLATAFSADDIANVMKAAVKNAVKLETDEPFTLKGNPPPRFQKKKPAEAAPEAADQPAAES